MTPTTKRGRHSAFELQTAQPTLLPEGPIKTINPEILEYILFLTNQSENTRWVCHEWKDLTITAVKYTKKPELTQTIQLIIEKLNPYKHALCITNLDALQTMQQSFSDYLVTLEKVRHYFLVGKGLVICILRSLPEEERNQLQNVIGAQLPDSTKNVFEISTLNIRTVENVDLDTFFTLLQSAQPLSMKDREEAALHAAFISNLQYLKALLTNGPISDTCRAKIIWGAIRKNDLELIEWVLANGSISRRHLGRAVWIATENNYLIGVKWLLAYGLISEFYRGLAVVEAARNNHIEIVKILLTDGPISEEDQKFALYVANEINNPELIQLLCARETNPSKAV
jgi:hypothetical protein